jgi:CRISPR type III-A-associated RAMP protein Csm4
MNPGLAIQLRPTGPWRFGPDNGARDEAALLYRSDTLYSAVTSAMAALGDLDAWLDATARHPEGPAVAFSSLFPVLDNERYVVPPRTVWPPDAVSGKVRWKGARFVPLRLIGALYAGELPEEAEWRVDGPSQCLTPAASAGVFRTVVRSSAAVDRLHGAIDAHTTAGIEFLPGAGLWTLASFAGEAERDRWSGPVRAAFRLLADSGFGGRRSHGWGRAAEPEFSEGALPEMIIPFAGEASHWWLLSLFSPGATDAVDWQSGNYAVVDRGGRVESPVRSGDRKKLLPMIQEGSVLASASAPRGAAPDVAPDGFPHPVYRSGFAVAIPVPAHAVAAA